MSETNANEVNLNPTPPPTPEGDKDLAPLLPDDLKSAGWLSSIRTVGGLAKSYDNVLKMASGNIKPVNKEDSWEMISKKSEVFYKLPKEEKEYKFNYQGEHAEDARKLAHKYKMHPTQIEGFLKDYNEAVKASASAKYQVEKDSWDSKNKEVFKDIKNKDELIGKALNKMGETSESFKTHLGKHADNPFVVKTLLSLGQSLEKTPDGVPVVSGGVQPPDAVTANEKFNYVKGHMNNPNSSYYNNKAVDHLEVKAKVLKYTQQLQQAQNKDDTLNFNLFER